MKQKLSQNFLIGLIIGTLIGVAIWYWQKSTSAEDGALDLLDRLAVAERKVNQMRADFGQKVQRNGGEETAVLLPPTPPAKPTQPDDLTEIKGIGPTFAARLYAANIDTYTKLKQLSVDELTLILNINQTRATNLLSEAQKS